MGNAAGAGIGRGTVDFLSEFTGSEQFDQVFKEGMGLVEETANYLDGPGRGTARRSTVRAPLPTPPRACA